jgi:hypothetical protein
MKTRISDPRSVAPHVCALGKLRVPLTWGPGQCSCVGHRVTVFFCEMVLGEQWCWLSRGSDESKSTPRKDISVWGRAADLTGFCHETPGPPSHETSGVTGDRLAGGFRLCNLPLVGTEIHPSFDAQILLIQCWEA